MYVNDGSDLILPESFLSEAGLSLLPHLSILLESYTSAKVNFELFAEYILFKDESEEIDMKSFQSKMTIMNKDSDLENIFHEHTMEIISKTQEFQERDSGWSLIKLIRLEMNVNHYTPMAGSSFIPLPRFLLTKKAIVNVCNENDHYCFKWALISALKIVNRPQRCSAYNIDISLEIIRISDEIILDFTGLTFPLEIKCIKNFLKKNTHMSLNVFGYNEETREIIGPLFQSEVEKPLHINMMFLEEGGNGHYMYIKNISR